METLVVERFSQARGLRPDQLDLDTPLEGEDWEEELVHEICREVGVAPEAIFPPATGSQRSELAVAGLRRLAPYSQRAERRLQEMEVRWEITTLHSFIRSLEERRPMASGEWITSEDQPIPLGRSLLRFGACTAGLALPVTVFAWGGCEPACRVCPSLPAVALSPGLTLPLALVSGWHLLLLLAALRELRQAAPGAALAPSGG